jgi:hypothetical protein
MTTDRKMIEKAEERVNLVLAELEKTANNLKAGIENAYLQAATLKIAGFICADAAVRDLSFTALLGKIDELRGEVAFLNELKTEEIWKRGSERDTH